MADLGSVDWYRAFGRTHAGQAVLRDRRVGPELSSAAPATCLIALRARIRRCRLPTASPNRRRRGGSSQSGSAGCPSRRLRGRDRRGGPGAVGGQHPDAARGAGAVDGRPTRIRSAPPSRRFRSTRHRTIERRRTPADGLACTTDASQRNQGCDDCGAHYCLARSAMRWFMSRVERDLLSDWMPTHEHFPRSKREGGKVAVDNAILAHRLCNRIDYSISVGRSYARDLERIRKAREDAIRRNTKDWTPQRNPLRPGWTAQISGSSELGCRRLLVVQPRRGRRPVATLSPLRQRPSAGVDRRATVAVAMSQAVQLGPAAPRLQQCGSAG